MNHIRSQLDRNSLNMIHSNGKQYGIRLSHGVDGILSTAKRYRHNKDYYEVFSNSKFQIMDDSGRKKTVNYIVMDIGKL